jgi:hypothetical protein
LCLARRANNTSPKLAAQLFEKNTRFEEDTRTKYNFWWPLT